MSHIDMQINLFVSLCNVFFSGFLLDVLSLLIKMKLP